MSSLSYECHKEESVSKDLNEKQIESLIFPGCCTMHVQAPDVSWNKPKRMRNMPNGCPL